MSPYFLPLYTHVSGPRASSNVGSEAPRWQPGSWSGLGDSCPFPDQREEVAASTFWR